MEDTTTEVIERTLSGEIILTTSMETEITISAVLMDTGTLIPIILMDTETAILEDTWTLILMSLINTASKEDSTVTKVMEIL